MYYKSEGGAIITVHDFTTLQNAWRQFRGAREFISQFVVEKPLTAAQR
jgi:hypothetical protein